MKTELAVICISLLICAPTICVAASTMPSLSIVLKSNGNIIYVNCNNTEGPWNGTWEHPFRRIRDGIGGSAPGDTVFVCRGTYHERVSIQKAITLHGEDQYHTIINTGSSGGAAIYVMNTPNVTINNFTLINEVTQENTEGIWAYTCPGIVISNITAVHSSGTSYGICLFYSNHALITQTHLAYKIWRALYIQNSSNVIVSKNYFTKVFGNMVDDGYGVYITGSNHITLTQNHITDNSKYGIFILNSYEITLTENFIQKNTDYGLSLLSSNNNTVTHNEISMNMKKGVFIEHSTGNKIIENNLQMNGEQLYFHNAFQNRWNANFWGNSSFRLHPFMGIVSFQQYYLSFPIWKVDWHSVKKSYDIPIVS